MNLQRLACTLFMMTTMALAGCGGGGGGGGGAMTGMMETPTPTPETPTPTPETPTPETPTPTPETPTPTPETPTPTPDVSSMPSVSVFGGDLSPTQEVADNIVTAIGRSCRGYAPRRQRHAIVECGQ